MSKLITQEVILCRKCLSLALNRTLCKCHNVGVIVDDEGFLHVYVNDITTTQRALLYHINGKEVRRELLQGFQEAIYSDYSVLHEPFTFKPKAPKRYEDRVTKTTYDEDLMKALDRDFYKTSDGKEVFTRTAT